MHFWAWLYLGTIVLYDAYENKILLSGGSPQNKMPPLFQKKSRYQKSN